MAIPYEKSVIAPEHSLCSKGHEMVVTMLGNFPGGYVCSVCGTHVNDKYIAQGDPEHAVDRYRVVAEFALHCPTCDERVCASCCTRPRCPKGHRGVALKSEDLSKLPGAHRGYVCCLCDKPNSSNVTLHCFECGTDVCPPCQFAPHCWNRHPVKQVKASDVMKGDVQCSLCKDKLNQGYGHYCSTCHFIGCQRCKPFFAEPVRSGFKLTTERIIELFVKPSASPEVTTATPTTTAVAVPVASTPVVAAPVVAAPVAPATETPTAPTTRHCCKAGHVMEQMHMRDFPQGFLCFSCGWHVKNRRPEAPIFGHKWCDAKCDNDLVFACKACQEYVCRQCITKPLCPNGHHGVMVSPSNLKSLGVLAPSCFKCARTFASETDHWRYCFTCDKACCSACQHDTVCCEGHEMKQMSVSVIDPVKKAANCSVCNEHISSGFMHNCPTCQFKVCQSCKAPVFDIVKNGADVSVLEPLYKREEPVAPASVATPAAPVATTPAAPVATTPAATATPTIAKPAAACPAPATTTTAPSAPSCEPPRRICSKGHTLSLATTDSTPSGFICATCGVYYHPRSWEQTCETNTLARLYPRLAMLTCAECNLFVCNNCICRPTCAEQHVCRIVSRQRLKEEAEDERNDVVCSFCKKVSDYDTNLFVCCDACKSLRCQGCCVNAKCCWNGHKVKDTTADAVNKSGVQCSLCLGRSSGAFSRVTACDTCHFVACQSCSSGALRASPTDGRKYHDDTKDTRKALYKTLDGLYDARQAALETFEDARNGIVTASLRGGDVAKFEKIAEEHYAELVVAETAVIAEVEKHADVMKAGCVLPVPKVVIAPDVYGGDVPTLKLVFDESPGAEVWHKRTKALRQLTRKLKVQVMLEILPEKVAEYHWRKLERLFQPFECHSMRDACFGGIVSFRARVEVSSKQHPILGRWSEVAKYKMPDLRPKVARHDVTAVSPPGHFAGTWLPVYQATANGGSASSNTNQTNCVASMVIGNMQLAPNAVTSWSIGVMCTEVCSEIGIAPTTVTQLDNPHLSRNGYYYSTLGLKLTKRDVIEFVADTATGTLTVTAGRHHATISFPVGTPLVPAICMGGNQRFQLL